MKRIIIGLLAAFLTTAGLVSFSSQSATAACPYTNCVATQTSSDGLRIDRNTAIYDVTVRSAGNTAPRGRVRFVVTRYATNNVFRTQIRRVAKASTNTSEIDFSTGNLPRGNYTVRFTFTPDSGTVFKASSSARKLSIR